MKKWFEGIPKVVDLNIIQRKTPSFWISIGKRLKETPMGGV